MDLDYMEDMNISSLRPGRPNHSPEVDEVHFARGVVQETFSLLISFMRA